MYQFRHSVHVPRTLTTTPVYGIVTRNSLYGFHKQASTRTASPLLDPGCSKTNLLVSTNKEIMDHIMDRMVKGQKEGRRLGSIDDTGDTLGMVEAWTQSIMPMQIEVFVLEDLLKLCHLHYFDISIIFNMERVDDVYFTLYTYTFTTNEPPGRGIVESYFRDMLYKKH